MVHQETREISVATANTNSQAGKEMLLHLLRASREHFLSSFSGVSDADSRRKPAEDCWCILDTVEHLTMAEGYMLKLITEARRSKSAGLPDREQVFLTVIADRSRKSQAPEPSRPVGRFANLDDAAVRFKASRDRTIQFVEQCNEDLRATEVTHPHPAAGIVSTFEMLIIMAQHAERHALQIEEIKNNLALHTATAGSQG
jgi:uncharacterized damage-inducible protein DinB